MIIRGKFDALIDKSEEIRFEKAEKILGSKSRDKKNNEKPKVAPKHHWDQK